MNHRYGLEFDIAIVQGDTELCVHPLLIFLISRVVFLDYFTLHHYLKSHIQLC